MENLVFVLAFVNGILLTISCYYTYNAIIVRKQYEGMLGQQAQLQNQQTIENAGLAEKIDDLERVIVEVERGLEADGYQKVAEQARKVEALERICENHAKQFALNEGSKKQMLEELSTIRQNIRKFGDDPTLVRGY